MPLILPSFFFVRIRTEAAILRLKAALVKLSVSPALLSLERMLNVIGIEIVARTREHQLVVTGQNPAEFFAIMIHICGAISFVMQDCVFQ
jgi:hypothetical protein